MRKNSLLSMKSINLNENKYHKTLNWQVLNLGRGWNIEGETRWETGSACDSTGHTVLLLSGKSRFFLACSPIRSFLVPKQMSSTAPTNDTEHRADQRTGALGLVRGELQPMDTENTNLMY